MSGKKRAPDQPPDDDRAACGRIGRDRQPPAAPGTQYAYRPSVLEALAGHGVNPRPTTPPAVARAFLNDLYRYEIRLLRARLLRGAIPKADYASRVAALRQRYPLLSLPIALWLEPGAEETLR